MDNIIAPNILKIRAELIAKKKLDQAYKTNNPHVLRCVVGSETIFIDLFAKKVIPTGALPSGNKTEETKSKAEQGDFTSAITREKALPPAKGKKEAATKKATSTKKKK